MPLLKPHSGLSVRFTEEFFAGCSDLFLCGFLSHGLCGHDQPAVLGFVLYNNDFRAHGSRPPRLVLYLEGTWSRVSARWTVVFLSSRRVFPDNEAGPRPLSHSLT